MSGKKEKAKEPSQVYWAVERLKGEASRFEDLARELALKSVRSDIDCKSRALAREHLLRAETFKDAAALVAKLEE